MQTKPVRRPRPPGHQPGPDVQLMRAWDVARLAPDEYTQHAVTPSGVTDAEAWYEAAVRRLLDEVGAAHRSGPFELIGALAMSTIGSYSEATVPRTGAVAHALAMLHLQMLVEPIQHHPHLPTMLAALTAGLRLGLIVPFEVALPSPGYALVPTEDFIAHVGSPLYGILLHGVGSPLPCARGMEDMHRLCIGMWDQAPPTMPAPARRRGRVARRYLH